MFSSKYAVFKGILTPKKVNADALAADSRA
jgi:hypothetical protein